MVAGAKWSGKPGSRHLEDEPTTVLMEQRVELSDERAQLDATVAEYVERNTKVERERLQEEKKQAEERVRAAEQRAAAAEKARETAITRQLHAEKEADKTTTTYKTRLQALSKKESEFDSKKANNDAECGAAWSRIEAEIENLLQQTSLLPPATDETERSSRVANIQFKKDSIQALWGQFGNVCRVSK